MQDSSDQLRPSEDCDQYEHSVVEFKMKAVVNRQHSAERH